MFYGFYGGFYGAGGVGASTAPAEVFAPSSVAEKPFEETTRATNTATIRPTPISVNHKGVVGSSAARLGFADGCADAYTPADFGADGEPVVSDVASGSILMSFPCRSSSTTSTANSRIFCECPRMAKSFA